MNDATTIAEAPAQQVRDRSARAALLAARYGYYLRAASSGIKILASAIRHGAPRIVIAQDRDFGNIVDRGRQDERRVAGHYAIAETLAQARRDGTPVTTAGAAHSGAGQTLARSGIRLRLETAPGETAVWLDEARLEVPATWHWHEAEAAANARGRTFPVLTDNLDTRVGGTLSVGGIGTRSIVYGRQVDCVDALTLIRPDGTIVRCSSSTEPELFAAALAGLGQVGVIGRVVLQTIPLRPWVASPVYQIASLSDAARLTADDLGGPENPPTHFEVVGPQIGSRYIHLRLGWEAASRDAAAGMLARLRRHRLRIPSVLRSARVVSSQAFGEVNVRHVQSFVASLNGASHLWNDWFFADSAGYRRFVDWCEQTLLPRLGTQYLIAGFLLRIARRPGRPHLPLSYAETDAPHIGHIGLYYSVPSRDAARRDAVCRGLTEAQAVARDNGGRLYLYGWQQWNKADWQAEYGADCERILALKRRLDPDFLLNPEVLRTCRYS
jgi:FAD/FMN-containing dehydrogenase